jgi:hypothetical protein
MPFPIIQNEATGTLWFKTRKKQYTRLKTYNLGQPPPVLFLQQIYTFHFPDIREHAKNILFCEVKRNAPNKQLIPWNCYTIGDA